jgi:hypothetical protein
MSQIGLFFPSRRAAVDAIPEVSACLKTSTVGSSIRTVIPALSVAVLSGLAPRKMIYSPPRQATRPAKKNLVRLRKGVGSKGVESCSGICT